MSEWKSFEIDGKKQVLYVDGKRSYGKVRLRGLKLINDSDPVHVQSDPVQYFLEPINFFSDESKKTIID